MKEPRWKIIFPASPNGEAVKNAGYISTAHIDGYDNGCTHVQPVGGTIASTRTDDYRLGWSYAWGEPYDLGFAWGTNYIIAPNGLYYFYNFPTNAIYGSSRKPELEWFTSKYVRQILAAQQCEVYYYNNRTPTELTDHFRVSNIVDYDKATNVINYLDGRDPLTDHHAEMFYTAMDELRLTSNNIANAMELVKVVKALRDPVRALEDLLSTAVKKGIPKDLWLKYRYVYTTTKMDVTEMSQKSKSLTGGVQRLRSSASSALSELHLRVDCKPYTGYVDPFSALFQNLERYGLQPSLYNAWDLIPFSFIADWFLPIGEELEKLDQITWAASAPYSVSCLGSRKCNSIEYGSEQFKVYQRYRYIPTYDNFVSNSSTRTHTWLKRGLDVISLL